MTKRFLLLMIVGLMAWPTLAQDTMTVDVDEVAESVVSIIALQGNRAVGSGSGTIMESSGLIYTNRHVIEVGQDYAIYMLNDTGDPPELRYFASPAGASDAIDFALLQIDRDANGRAINADSLNLNTIPIASEPIQVGDEINVYGFPGISEGLLTVTSGEIVTVQNGSLYGERLPVWYWTDAEISSGNSGGLAINEAGEFVGIPTWVRAEARTAGRFGGVLPYQTILLELGDSADRAPTQSVPAGQNVELVIENTDDAAICYVYISRTSAETWGEDQLGENEILDVGEALSLQVEAGYYDVLLNDCDQEPLNDVRNVDLTEDVILTHEDELESTLARPAPATPAQTAQTTDRVTVTLENQDDATICYLYISPTTSMEWGEDQLGDQRVIRPDETITLEVVPGTYDFLLEDCDRERIDDAFGLELTEDTALVQEPV